MSGVDRDRVAMYLGSSTRKVYLANFHLGRFRESLQTLRAQGRFFARAGPDDPFIPVDAHADACVLQLFGAFDAFACAAAWQFGLPGDRDRFSFSRLAANPPAAIAQDVGRELPDHQQLSGHRHTAAHRGFFNQKRVLSAEDGITLRTAEGEEVLSVLEPLVQWGRGAMTRLHIVAESLGWVGPGDAYLLT